MGNNIDLQGLIDQVLSMVKSNLEDKEKLSKKAYRDELHKNAKDATDAYNLMMGRTPELKLQELKNTGNIDWQKVANTGQTNIQELKNTGEFARQTLEGSQKLEQGAQTGKFGTKHATIAAEGNIEGHRLNAEGRIQAAKIGAEGRESTEAIKMGLPAPPSVSKGRQIFSGEATQKTSAVPELSPVATSPVASAVPQPAVNPSTVQARVGLPGRESMEFRAPGTMSLEDQEKKKKESEARMLYGTKPQNRNWLSSF